MAAWLIPALKAVLPHVSTIITMAKPVFTRKSADPVSQPSLLQQQITELQSAASQNAANIKELAEQLQKTVAALEQAGALVETRLRRAVWLSAAAFAVSAISFCAALLVILAR
jgi:hypothetical protein